MKKINILIIGILWSLSCMSQKKVTLSEAININIPNETETLSRDQFSSYIHTKFAYSGYIQNDLKSSSIVRNNNNNDHYYRINNILISVFHGVVSKNYKSNYVKELKKGLDAMNNRFKTDSSYYNSVIKTINNNQVLIISEVHDNVGVYKFFSSDNKELYLNGELQFGEADAAEAEILLDEILESIEFKK